MIIFLYGEDQFSSQEKLSEIKNKFLSKNPSGLGLRVFDFSEEKEAFQGNDMLSIFGSQGLFSSKQLIVIKDIIGNGSKKEQDSLLSFLDKNNGVVADQDTIIVFCEGKMSNQKNKLFQYLEKNAKKQKFEKLKEVKLQQWIRDEVTKENSKIKISAAAGRKLAEFSGDDLFALSNEIKKLANLKENGTIGEEDVDLLVNARVNASIFETVDAISSGNKALALKRFHDQLESGEDLFYLLSMYIYQFRNILKVGDFYWRGVTDRYQIARETRLHPFMVQKILFQIRNFTEEKTEKIYQKLQAIDLGVKTGRIDIKTAIDKFIVET